MDRRKFIAKTCSACLSAAGMATLIASCNSSHYITGSLGKDGINLNKAEFILKQDGSQTYRPFIIIRNDALQYPICVYRLNDNEYSALWMSCTHQGTELQAASDTLQCAAHGSEFDRSGLVKSGPADLDLRKFPITVTGDQLFIDLRAI